MSDDTVERLRRDFDAAWRLSIAHGEEVTRCDLADTTMFFLDRVIGLLEGVIRREHQHLPRRFQYPLVNVPDPSTDPEGWKEFQAWASDPTRVADWRDFVRGWQIEHGIDPDE